MRDLEIVASECIRELAAIGISCGNVLVFSVNTRAKKRWGMCKQVPNGFEIEIAAVLLQDAVPLVSLKNTIIHELLHTCPDCGNHGPAWKRLADRVNRAYGYGIRRLSSAEEKGVAGVGGGQVRYRFVCKDCGQVVERMRSSKFTRNYTRYRCGKCGGCFRKITVGENDA